MQGSKKPLLMPMLCGRADPWTDGWLIQKWSASVRVRTRIEFFFFFLFYLPSSGLLLGSCEYELNTLMYILGFIQRNFHRNNESQEIKKTLHGSYCTLYGFASILDTIRTPRRPASSSQSGTVIQQSYSWPQSTVLVGFEWIYKYTYSKIKTSILHDDTTAAMT